MVFVCGRNRFDFRATHFVDVVVSSELASRLLLPPPLLYLDQMLWRLEMLSTLWKKGLEKSRENESIQERTTSSKSALLLSTAPSPLPPSSADVSGAVSSKRNLR